MTESNNQILALKKAAQDKKEDTQLKVTTVLRVMKEKNLPINFESVAKLSGVSKTWLYHQPKFKNEIEVMRVKKGKIQRAIDLKSTVEQKNNEILSLKTKNKTLEETIKKLRQQLEIVYGELYNQPQQ